jgi:hypothetical protein
MDPLCIQAEQLLNSYCLPSTDGWQKYYCDSWKFFADFQCGTVPCEQQLCAFNYDCVSPLCSERCHNNPTDPLCSFVNADTSQIVHLCSYYNTNERNAPYLTYRVMARCPLRFPDKDGMPLYEDLRISPQYARDVLGFMNGTGL